jgi:hypothetical protein
VLSPCEGLDDEHRGTAMPADEGGRAGELAGEEFAAVRGNLETRLVQQFARRRDMVLAMGVGQQSVVADAMKAGGQHVQLLVAEQHCTWITRISTFCSSRWVAKLCRRVCIETRLSIRAAKAASCTARLS